MSRQVNLNSQLSHQMNAVADRRPAVARSIASAVFACALIISSTVAAANERPFKARLSGNANLSPTDDPCVMRNDETAQGNASHMGQITWESVEFVNFCTVQGGVAVTGSFVITAANGDQLFGTYETIGFPDVNGNLIIHGDYWFDGGTGRFEDATGSGDIDAEASLAPGFPFDGRLTGTIEY
jgi:hypothetical protein